MTDAIVIYKYPLKIVPTQEIELPCKHELLDIQVQAGVICMWLAVQPDSPKKTFVFHLVGTGHEPPSGTVTYIKTVQLDSLVWHIFDGE